MTEPESVLQTQTSSLQETKKRQTLFGILSGRVEALANYSYIGQGDELVFM